jgi:putative ABC transport system permease protein
MVEGVVVMAVHPLRTALCTLGVVIGLAAVVATLTIADGIERFARDQIATQTDVQAVAVSSKTVETRDGFPYPTRRHPIFGPRDAADLQDAMRAGAQVTMSATGSSVAESATGAPHVVSVTASLGNFLLFGGRTVLAGRYFTDVEATHAAPVVVLSHKLAVELSRDGNPLSIIDEQVRVHGIALTVIGVMPPFPGETNYQVFVPLRLAGKLLGAAKALLPQMFVRAPSLELVDATKDDVIGWAAGRYRDWEHQVSITTSLARLEQTRSAMLIMKLVLGALAAISLIVGGVGIMNVLLASVTERTYEIGIRKALGARERDILIQFLAESVAMSSVGSAVGLVLGLGAAIGMSWVVRFAVPGAVLETPVTGATLFISLGSAIGMGLTFGIFPAIRASRLSPIDAIRHE